MSDPTPQLVAPFSRARLIAQDSFLHRARDGSWQSHAKLVSLPLGSKFKLQESWASVMVEALEARVMRTEPLIVRDNGMGVRRYITEQLTARFAEARASSRARGSESEFMRELVRTVAIAAPPGYGSDTYRPYEALACGAMPVVLRGESLIKTWRTLPMLIVDDYSSLNRTVLDAAAAHMTALVHANKGESLLQPLTEEFWAERLVSAARRGRANIRPGWPSGGFQMDLPGRDPSADLLAVGGRACCGAGGRCKCGFAVGTDRPCCAVQHEPTG